MTDRTTTRADDSRLRHHRLILAFSCAISILAFGLEERPDTRVSLRGMPELLLPQACFSRTWLGLKCPGCGMTRSLIHLAGGEWSESWRDHRLGGLIAFLIVLQVPYRLFALFQPDHTPIRPRWQVVLAYALIALLLGNWLVELAAGRVTAVS